MFGAFASPPGALWSACNPSNPMVGEYTGSGHSSEVWPPVGTRRNATGAPEGAGSMSRGGKSVLSVPAPALLLVRSPSEPEVDDIDGEDEKEDLGEDESDGDGDVDGEDGENHANDGGAVCSFVIGGMEKHRVPADKGVSPRGKGSVQML